MCQYLWIWLNISCKVLYKGKDLLLLLARHNTMTGFNLIVSQCNSNIYFKYAAFRINSNS